MTTVVSAPVPCQASTVDEQVNVTAGTLIAALDVLNEVLEALIPGSSIGRSDIAGEGLMAHMEGCRVLAEYTAQSAHKIADILGTRK